MRRTVLVLPLLAAPLFAQWGADINPGMGPQLLRSVRADLAAIVTAPAKRRKTLVDGFVARHGVERMEAWKRFRNAELGDLFRALLEQDDWHVRHRALLALERCGDPRGVTDRAWELLGHPHRRLRERAALALLVAWDGREPAGRLDERLRDETDSYVRKCLEALARRREGKLAVDRVAREFVRTGADGLMETPWLSGMDGLGRAAPGYRPEPVARTGRGRATRLRPASRWTWPLLGFGEEEVAGVSLQPYSNPRQGGRVLHTGVDAGACLDGAGLYAIAEGVVMLVHTGSDMGTLLVVRHRVDKARMVNAVYMHGGPVVFVRAGDRVACGQLLGTMGLGFSIENGGHFAHLHFGLYPGPFRLDHNYGYKPAADGLADWIDPVRFLAGWIERTRPLLEFFRPLHRDLAVAERAARRGEFGRAYLSAVRVRDGAEPGGEPHADAVFLAGLLARTPRDGLARARKRRDAGFPQSAIDDLEGLAARCRGIPGAEALPAALAEWQGDPGFKRALAGERRVEAALARAARPRADREEVRRTWQRLLRDYGDTCLRPRIEEQLR